MADWDNKTKQGVSANLWSNVVMPWDLSLPWQYVNPTPISYTNKSVNSTSWTNKSKTVDGSGLFKGFPFGITEAGTIQTPWTNKTKN
jgi:hypothetical protein